MVHHLYARQHIQNATSYTGFMPYSYSIQANGGASSPSSVTEDFVFFHFACSFLLYGAGVSSHAINSHPIVASFSCHRAMNKICISVSVYIIIMWINYMLPFVTFKIRFRWVSIECSQIDGSVIAERRWIQFRNEYKLDFLMVQFYLMEMDEWNLVVSWRFYYLFESNEKFI